jgi:hypothetical protein
MMVFVVIVVVIIIIAAFRPAEREKTSSLAR